MKNKLPLITAFSAAGLIAQPATASDVTYSDSTIPAVHESRLSGSISLDYNSHFISYGLDVWGGGTNLTDGDTFNPALSIDYIINDAWTFHTGFWLDVNDNPSGSDFDTQETDTWFGVSYKTGITTFSATYQSWQYTSDTEEIFDLKASFDTFLSPYILIHERLDAGAAALAGGDEGTFLVLGASYDFNVNESLSFSVPVTVGFALGDFHTEEDGYGYGSIGLQGSYALSEQTSLNFGATYYNTDDDVTGNADNDFLTTNIGLSYSF